MKHQQISILNEIAKIEREKAAWQSGSNRRQMAAKNSIKRQRLAAASWRIGSGVNGVIMAAA